MTKKKKKNPAIDAERYCCSELYEHQCGILKKNNNNNNKTQIQMCTIYSCPTSKIPNI